MFTIAEAISAQLLAEERFEKGTQASSTCLFTRGAQFLLINDRNNYAN